MFFYIGLRIGEDRSAQDRVQACAGGDGGDGGDGGVHPSGHLQAEAEEVQECPKPPSMLLPSGSEIRCAHAYDQRRNLSVLHLGKATVPEDVFSFLHHPSSPSKVGVICLMYVTCIYTYNNRHNCTA
jgi:hypothetical protein